jgi:hypothetical protein
MLLFICRFVYQKLPSIGKHCLSLSRQHAQSINILQNQSDVWIFLSSALFWDLFFSNDDVDDDVDVEKAKIRNTNNVRKLSNILTKNSQLTAHQFECLSMIDKHTEKFLMDLTI